MTFCRLLVTQSAHHPHPNPHPITHDLRDPPMGGGGRQEGSTVPAPFIELVL